MESGKIQELLYRYNSGQASEKEIREIEDLIADGTIRLEDIDGFAKLESTILAIQTPEPSALLDNRFYKMLRDEKQVEGFAWKSFFNWNVLMPRLAFASFGLLMGLAAG